MSSNSLKVLYCDAGCDRRGHFGINAAKLCQALSKMGHDVLLVTNKICLNQFLYEQPLFKIVEVEDGKYELEEYIKNRVKHPYRYYYAYFRNSYFIFKNALKLAIKYNVDIIHGTGIEFGVASLILLVSNGKLPPILWEVQAANFTFNTYAGNFILCLYKSLQRRIFKRVIGKCIKGFAVLGDYQKEIQRKQLSIREDFSIEVIREGGDGPREVIDKKVAQERIGISNLNGHDVFLFFGLLRRDKGIEYLLRAIPLVKREKFSVVIAGAPIDYKKDDIQRMVDELGIQNKVILNLKYIPADDVPFYFFASDALVLPYTKKYTGGSGPLFNEGACAHGKPCIVSDVSEMGRVTKIHQIGLVFNPENPQSIAERLSYFIDLPFSERQRLSENARAFAKQNTWGIRAEKYLALYSKLIWCDSFTEATMRFEAVHVKPLSTG